MFTFQVVELLLNRGANKEHRNVSDYTPLSLAASGGYVNIIKLLLSHNAEINSRYVNIVLNLVKTHNTFRIYAEVNTDIFRNYILSVLRHPW